MMTDPISDMLTRIRNGLMAKKAEVHLPYSKMKFAIAAILLKEGYLASVDKVHSRLGKFDDLQLVLKYDSARRSVIHALKRISKPGSRIYTGYQELKNSSAARGLRIVSTPKGLMTDKEAIKAKIGGEVLCEVY